MRFRAVFRFLGRQQLILGLTLLVPLVTCLIYREFDDAVSFAICTAVTVVVGAFMILATRQEKAEVLRREGILIVVGGWVLASVFGALPYLLTGVLTSPVDALFEAASGFTTTGATVLPEIEGSGYGLLMWRSFTQWLGGMGIIVLFVALLPEVGPGARFLYKLEVPGPTADALHPRIRDTAAVVWKIYLFLTLAETVLLMLLGMSLYDALNHTFATLSTGGFSPKNASIAAYDSPAIHLVIIFFMILAGTNFSLFYGMKMRSRRNLFRDYEFRIFISLIGAASLLVMSVLLWTGTYTQPFKAAVDTLFQVVSIMTTTGFATADFDLWPSLSKLTIVIIMFCGGCAGSTSGSMKIMRMVIGLKSAFREVRTIFSPNTVLSVHVGPKRVPESVVHSVAGFFILFLSLWGLGTFLLSFSGSDLVTAATAAIATLGNIGPGLSNVGPTQNFAAFTAFDKLVMVVLMWMGRLEVYAIVALFTRAFWRP